MEHDININLFLEALDNTQKTSACHLKYAVMLKKESEKNTVEFAQVFCKCLNKLLQHSYKGKNDHVTRLVDFLALFCSQFKNKQDSRIDHPFLMQIFAYLLEASDCILDSVRFWSCKLINKIFDKIDDLEEDVCDKIKDKMLNRIHDSRAAISYEAIISLYRLQDPSNTDDPITKEFINVLLDSNAKIRELAVSKIAVTKATIPEFLQSIRDINANVRLATFKKIVKLVRYLKIEQRRFVLQSGILDSDPKIKLYVETELLPSWLETYENDCLQFLKSIRFDACESDIELTVFLTENILNTLFRSKCIEEVLQSLQLNSDKCLDYDKLNWESAIYWRVSIDYFQQLEHFDEISDEIRPELMRFCDYIKGYLSYVHEQKPQMYDLEHQFITKQIFLIALHYDLCDPAGQIGLQMLARDVLLKEKLNVDVARVILENLERIIDDVNNCSVFVCEIISSIMYGEEEVDFKAMAEEESRKSEEISKIKRELSDCKERQERAIEESDFSEASNLEKEIEFKQAFLLDLQKPRESEEPMEMERKTDLETILRYLTVAEALLISPKIKQINAAISSLNSDTIQKLLIHDDYAVKTKAFKCYAQCCIMDRTLARAGIHILSIPIFAYSNGEECDSELLVACILGVVDLLRVFGSSLIANPNEELMATSQVEEAVKVFVGGTSLTDLIKALADFLDDEDLKIQRTAAQAVCRLLISRNRVSSVTLISRLILKWANPISDDENNTVKQIIGETLKYIPHLPNCEEYFDDIIIITVRTLIYAPKNSPLIDVNVDNIIKFLLALVETSNKASEINGNLAIKICSKMIDKPTAKINLCFSKILLWLRLTHDNDGVVRDLLNICDQLRDAISNRVISNNIIKFNAILTHITQTLPPIEE